MTTLRITALALLATAVSVSGLVSAPEAQARGAKEYFQQTYQFDRPMNGYQGFSGAYHCSYVKTPKTVCTAKGKCKRVWELLQTCQ